MSGIWKEGVRQIIAWNTEPVRASFRQMRSRSWILLAVSGVTLVLAVIVWILSLFAWSEANGIALGLRRFRDDYDLVCGVHGANSRDSEIWYFSSVVPLGGAHRLG